MAIVQIPNLPPSKTPIITINIIKNHSYDFDFPPVFFGKRKCDCFISPPAEISGGVNPRSERKYSNAKQHYNKINRFNICIMLNFCEYIYEKTVNDLVKNCTDIDLFSVIEKGKNYHCHSHNKRRCAD